MKSLLKKELIDLGSKVRQKRLEKGLTQEGLADIAGVHRTYIGMIERGEKNASLLSIYKVSDALKVDIKDLL